MRSTHRLDITHRLQFQADDAFAASRIAKAVEDAQHTATVRAVRNVQMETVSARLDVYREGEFQKVGERVNVEPDRQSRLREAAWFAVETFIAAIFLLYGFTEREVFMVFVGLLALLQAGRRNLDG